MQIYGKEESKQTTGKPPGGAHPPSASPSRPGTSAGQRGATPPRNSHAWGRAKSAHPDRAAGAPSRPQTAKSGARGSLGLSGSALGIPGRFLMKARAPGSWSGGPRARYAPMTCLSGFCVPCRVGCDSAFAHHAVCVWLPTRSPQPCHQRQAGRERSRPRRWRHQRRRQPLAPRPHHHVLRAVLAAVPGPQGEFPTAGVRVVSRLAQNSGGPAGRSMLQRLCMTWRAS